MTVQGVAGPTWLLRLLLVVGLGLLVAVLTSLWSTPSAHAVPPSEGAPDGATVTDPVRDATVPATSVAEALDPLLASVTEPVARVPSPVTETVTPFLAPVAATVEPVAETVAPVAEAVAPVAETVAPVAETVAPVAEAVAPVAETAAPVAEALTPVTETVAPAVDAVAPVAEAASEVAPAPVTGELTTPVVSPVLDALRPATAPLLPHPGSRERAPRATVSVDLPATPGLAATPCPPAAAPVVATLRPSSPWHPRAPRDSGPLPDDRLPVVVPPPAAEHVRGGTSDHPRPTGGPAAGLSMPSAGISQGGRGGAVGDLPAEVEPPQLRVLSSRAGPCARPPTAPQIEILDSPA